MLEFFSGLSILFHCFVCLYLFLHHNVLITMCVLSHSIMSDSSWSHGLQPTGFLCPWGFSRQEYWSGLPCPPPGDLPNPGIEPRSPELQTDSLPTERPGKPFDYCGFVLESKVREHDSSSFVFHFQDCLGYLGSFVFQYKL